MSEQVAADVVQWASLGNIQQVAMVVHDLDASVRAYWQQLRIGPWTAYDLRPGVLSDMRYRGEPTEFAMRHALAWSGGVQLELVQPISGPSIFAEHLAEHGEGIHHLGIYVEDHRAAVGQFVHAGHQVLQSARGFGATGDGAFAYFAMDHPLAAVIELIKAPSTRREPAFIYPQPES